MIQSTMEEEEMLEDALQQVVRKRIPHCRREQRGWPPKKCVTQQKKERSQTEWLTRNTSHSYGCASEPPSSIMHLEHRGGCQPLWYHHNKDRESQKIWGGAAAAGASCPERAAAAEASYPERVTGGAGAFGCYPQNGAGANLNGPKTTPNGGAGSFITSTR